MTETPILSVIVTSYNVGEYLHSCLKSIQDAVGDIAADIIVVDDCSSDYSVQVAQSFARDDDRFRIHVFEENTPGGVAPAANKGLELAKGEYIAFVDGDDLCMGNVFADAIDLLRTYGADIAVFPNQLLNDRTGQRTAQNERWFWSEIKKKQSVFLNNRDQIDALLDLFPEPWRKVYCRKFLEGNSIRFLEVDHAYEDNPFHWQVILAAQSVVALNSPGIVHRTHRPGQSIMKPAIDRATVLNFADLIKQKAQETGREEVFSAYYRWLAKNVSWGGRRLGWSYIESQFEWIDCEFRDLGLEEFERAFVSRSPTRRTSRKLAPSAALFAIYARLGYRTRLNLLIKYGWHLRFEPSLAAYLLQKSRSE